MDGNSAHTLIEPQEHVQNEYNLFPRRKHDTRTMDIAKETQTELMGCVYAHVSQLVG